VRARERPEQLDTRLAEQVARLAQSEARLRHDLELETSRLVLGRRERGRRGLLKSNLLSNQEGKANGGEFPPKRALNRRCCKQALLGR
jgi:hypothetical protein